MDPVWASEQYLFPQNPRKGQEHTASDGSRWEFDVHNGGNWDLMNYSPECMSPGCPVLVEVDYCPDCLARGHHLGVDW